MALAPTASAVGSSACTVNTPDGDDVVTVNGANFRTGPGTSYSVKGSLYKGDRLRDYCTRAGSDGYLWFYAKLTQKSAGGLPSGTYGWIRIDMMRSL
ncbi:SH3 domain-containing protein [Streptomyces sp. NPDC006335]|uniref:SH3 domain-containing protein n=1 Tax=Streptomyces sp. NPDC006335 TaxID=3156895 RepID=UPI00339E35AB